MTTISIVIRSYNEEQHIGRLLTGLLKQSVKADQIILVDSGSTDATLSIASRFPVQIRTIEPAQFSFGRSLNLGCRAATGDLIAIASAHVFPLYDNWLAELTAPFAESDVALTYGRQEGDERTKYSERQIMARWFPPRSELRQSHAFANNANAAIRRSVWEEQPYDEELTGLEDLDWAQRALRRGYSISYVATAPVVHAHDETWAQLVNRYRREALAHRRIYHEQRMSAIAAVRLAIANIASDYWHAARDGVLPSNLASIPSFRIAQFWGTYQGFRRTGAAPAALRERFYYPHGIRRPRRAAMNPRGRPIDYDNPHVD
ncbi:MAG TPA: glycosyltransferase [Candidatus Limnocylindria bacterium]|nr:glycosyltransferase [Candidatus Limnocylindria bacterium]